MRLWEAHFRDTKNVKQLFDYGSRTDGQPVYSGAAVIGSSEDASIWVIHFFEYTAEGNISAIQSREGAWSARASLFV